MYRGKIEVDQYILKNCKDRKFAKLAPIINALYGTEYTRDSLRKRFNKLWEASMRKGKVKTSRQSDKRKQDFKTFLLKAKTEKEIVAKFGDLKLLKGKFDGLNLFTQRNHYNELVYILLPVVVNEVKILPRAFKYHMATDNPYLLVELPKFKGKVVVAPLFDVHYGNVGHKHEKFLGYLRWIKETPNVYVILGGDLMENAIEIGTRGMTYDQTTSPMSQLDRMVELLAPIAHKCLVSVPGNHEERTRKASGIDVAAILAERLKVPYFDGPVIMSLMGNGYKWTFYVHHGTGNSQTKGGRMNMASRPKMWTGLINFFVSGHVHDCIAESEVMLIEDPLNCRVVEMKQWTVISQSFLKWFGTYAYRAEYKPSSAGGVSMELYENGEYKAYLTE